MNILTTRNIKIIFALVIAFVITFISTNTFFYPNSPRLNPQFLANIGKLFLQAHPKGDTYDELKNIPLSAMKKISQGVYAKEEPSLNTTFVRITSDAKFEIQNGILLQKKSN